MVSANAGAVRAASAWEAARSDLAAEKAWEEKMQRGEWRELYQRQEREIAAAPDPEPVEGRHTRERAELGREHGRLARDLEQEATTKYRAVVEAPIRSDQLDGRSLAEELRRMDGELSETDRRAFRQHQQEQGAGLTISLDRSRERGGFER